MGKGDKKTRKGKIAMGSYGNTRPHHLKKTETAPKVKAEKPAATNQPAKKPSVS